MENETQPTSRGKTIKSIYFYLVSFVALMMIVWSTADLINTALKTWVFTKADSGRFYISPCVEPTYVGKPGMPGIEQPTFNKEACEKQNEMNKKIEEENASAQKQRDVVRDISMIAVGIPLFMMHWRIVRRKDENL